MAPSIIDEVRKKLHWPSDWTKGGESQYGKILNAADAQPHSGQGSGVTQAKSKDIKSKKEDPNFLRALHDPEDAEIDLVAVHGLNPTNVAFHAEQTWTAENGRMWLRDFLPMTLPKARILLFGYNANVAFETSIDGVRE
ncbi:hypothetical protein QBC46DRAFT_345329 [Diplogelasinospora grovesii]|uniref:Uncharacterized protein n=1 Tax=Diplogelasinospora grovesii TaxID=303347 RepID=A0AAN6N052_9PEZI|nr:hypothetical protein QBC46DRAFT_345329 [Diplogelasinospora grovesii]